MKIINDERTDFSEEGLANLSVMMQMVYGSELIAYKMAAALDAMGISQSIFQNRKQALNRAKNLLRGFISQMEIAFDTAFDEVYGKIPGQEATRADTVHYLANDAIRLLLIYNSRGDGEPEKREKMLKALMNFKQSDPALDLNSMLKFYNFKIDYNSESINHDRTGD